MTVADTHVMVADMHRQVLAAQGGTFTPNHLVGETCYSPQQNTYHRPDSGQVSNTGYYVVYSLTFV